MTDLEDRKRVKPMDELAEFVMSFVDESRNERDDFNHIWDEVECNFLVRDFRQNASVARSTEYPLATQRTTLSTDSSGDSILIDPETHQEVVTLAAKLVLSLFPTDGGFSAAKGVGFEDIFKGKVVNELTEYTMHLPVHFWELVKWIVGTAVYGTYFMESGWEYKEEPRSSRTVSLDFPTGQEVSESTTLMMPVYDDPRMRVLNIRDVFPDMANDNIEDMLGIAKRFKLSADVAEARGESGIYDKASVQRAIEFGASDVGDETEDKPSDNQTDVNARRRMDPKFIPMSAFEYFGTVPFATDDGIQKRVITVINGETVRSDPWPRRVPIFKSGWIPRLGSIYDIGPAEVIRYDQDFVSFIKSMLADSIALMTHPPQIYNRQIGLDLSKLRRFHPKVPIGVDGDPSQLKTADYRPNVQPAFVMQSSVKQQMREGTGALDIVQGLGLGSKRASATEFQGTAEAAGSRPELFAVCMERCWLPPLGKYNFGLFQEFLEDTDDLRVRIGSSNVAPFIFLGDILKDFDIRFVGSRTEGGRAQNIAAFREIAQAGAQNPIIQQMVPWQMLIQKWFKDLGAEEIAAAVGDPNLAQIHAMMHQILQPGGQGQAQGNGNGTVSAQVPVGLQSAQELGGAQ